MERQEVSYLTNYGFVWDQIEVERTCGVRGWKILRMKIDGKPVLEIYVSPKGRSVRVWKRHKELKDPAPLLRQIEELYDDRKDGW